MPGSITWNADQMDLRFRLCDGTDTINVHSTGAPPAMFKDTIGVVVEGSFQRSGVFESTNLMVRHSNEYRPPKEGHMPEEMYKTLIKGDNGS